MTSFEPYYNTSKHHIVLREYGRTVQEMCDVLLKMQDREARNKTAQTIIEVMRQVNPTIPNNAPKDLDTENKLWDDLHIICNFELDIDAPFPPPEPDIIGKKPAPIPYKKNFIRLRHYGKNLELLVKEACLKPEGEEQYQAFAFILRLMKTYYSNWNVDNNQDGNFVGDMETLAGKPFPEELRERLLIEGGIIDPEMLARIKQRQQAQAQQDKQKKNQFNKNRFNKNNQNVHRNKNTNNTNTNTNNTNTNATSTNTNNNNKNRNNKNRFRNNKNKK